MRKTNAHETSIQAVSPRDRSPSAAWAAAPSALVLIASTPFRLSSTAFLEASNSARASAIACFTASIDLAAASALAALACASAWICPRPCDTLVTPFRACAWPSLRALSSAAWSATVFFRSATALAAALAAASSAGGAFALVFAFCASSGSCDWLTPATASSPAASSAASNGCRSCMKPLER